MIDIISKNILIIANGYIYSLLIISIVFAYHYDYKSLKKKKLIKESKISRIIAICYSILLVALIVTKQIVIMNLF